MAVAASSHAGSASHPLAVDLDGTLMRGDLFVEAMLRFVFANPLRVFVLAWWLVRGRAYAKARLAEQAPFDPAVLPYNEPLLAWLSQERARGRVLVLATASDVQAARAVAEHLGLFDDVFASDGMVNLKASKKAARLVAAFPCGFVYAGNDPADLKVWKRAAAAVIVNASPGLVRRASRKTSVERIFARDTGFLRSFIKAIRPQQWAKNILVFLPMILAHAWFDWQAWTAASQAFVALSLVASSVYIINDAADIDADRHHPRKRTRPFASGTLSPGVGLALAILAAAAGIALGARAGAIEYICIYLLVSTAYTFWIKEKQLVDVFVLASLYVLRVIIGGVATGFAVSSWLLAFCCFFFFSLALAKRVIEIDAAAIRGGTLKRRGYHASDGPILKMLGVSSGLVSCLVLAFYLQSDVVMGQYAEPLLLWVLPAGMMFWLCRLWLLVNRGEMHDDPLVFAARDGVSWLVAAIIASGFAVALNLPGGIVAWRP